MSDAKSPSFIVKYFVNEIASNLPAQDKKKLDSYAEAISKTTRHGDLKRARMSAERAVQKAERSSNSSLGHFVKHLEELRKLEKDSVFGAEFGAFEDVEIQWTDDAVAIAKAEGERVGWDSVPWEKLLKEMLAVVPPQQRSIQIGDGRQTGA
jgi:hypothetical protein